MIGCGDQLASAGELLGARVAAVGKQAIVSDVVQSLGQDVHEEQNSRLEGHGLVPVRTLNAVVLVFEGNSARAGVDIANESPPV